MKNVKKSAAMSRLEKFLLQLEITVYNTPVDTKDTLVALGRLGGDTGPNFKLNESRLLSVIEKILKVSKNADSWRVRLSRPWVLKEDKLRFTWDFTLQGDIEAALTALEAIKIPQLSVTRTEDVPVQNTKTKKGSVRPVRVGSV